MSVRLVIAGLLVLTAGCGEEEAAAPQASSTPPTAELDVPADAPKVIFLGDSISAGLHLDRPLEESFPARLQRRLLDEGLPFRLVNAGVSGDTSAGGVRRLSWMLRQEPDVLVVELGANDGLRGVRLDAIERNLRAIVTGARKAGVAVVLLGMRLPPNLGLDYVEGFAALYERVAKQDDVAFVPYFMSGVAGNADLNFPDGIHPTAEGHARLADNVLPVLRRTLRKP